MDSDVRSRGLLRLWVVFSIAWIIPIGFHAYTYWGIPALPPGYVLDWRSGELTTAEFLGRTVVIDVSHLAWAFGPPVAVLIIGAALSWAIAGFRK